MTEALLVRDAITGEEGFIFATIRGTPYLAVSISPLGATRAYCPACQRIFRMGETCPSCKEELE